MRIVNAEVPAASEAAGAESTKESDIVSSTIATLDTFHDRDDDANCQEERGAVPTRRTRSITPILLGIIGFFALWGWTANSAAANALSVFVNMPAAMITLIAPLAILTTVYGWAGVVDAVLWIFRKPTPGATAQDAAVFWQLFAAFSLVSGCIGTLIGLVALMTRLTTPGQIGAGIAISLLTQLYGVFQAVVGISLAAHIARRHKSAAAAVKIARRGAGLAGVTTIAGVLTAMIAFGMMMLSISPSL